MRVQRGIGSGLGKCAQMRCPRGEGTWDKVALGILLGRHQGSTHQENYVPFTSPFGGLRGSIGNTGAVGLLILE